MHKLVFLFFFLASCKEATVGPSAPPGVTIGSITVTSSSFSSKGPIPIDSSCDGKDASPELTWSAPPENTRSLALIVNDPDASGGAFTHWIVFNIPPEVRSLAAGLNPISIGASVGLNDFKKDGYNGPCPPRGEEHRYEFHLFALSERLVLAPGASREAMDQAMAGRVLGEGTLVGSFGH